MTIRVLIRNIEQSKVGDKLVIAPLYITLIEGIIVDGHVSEKRSVVTLESGQAQEFTVYAMRSLLLAAPENKP